MWRRRAYDVAIYSLVAVSAWWVARGAWGAGVEAYDASVHSYVVWSDARPPRPLRERKGDRQRYPRRGFGFVLWDGLRVDTFAGTAGNMRGLPDTTIELKLSDAQLDTLYDAVIRMRWFDDPRLQSALRSNDVPESRLTVQAGASTRVLAWNRRESWAIHGYHVRPLPDEWKRLDGLLRTIDRMVETDSTYRSLPKHWVAVY